MLVSRDAKFCVSTLAVVPKKIAGIAALFLLMAALFIMWYHRVVMFLNIQNARIHYTVEDSGQQDNIGSIVLLHGWGCNVSHYQKIRTHLAQKFKVYALDLPGFGLSPAPLMPWDTENYAQITAEFIRTLKIENPILLGHSMGGKIALYLTAKNLVPTQKLILVCSAGVKTRKRLAQYFKIYTYKLCKHLATLPLLKRTIAPKLIAYRNKNGSQDYRDANGIMRATLVKLVNEDWCSLMPNINVPTLLLWGKKDAHTPLENGITMQQLIPQSQLITFANASHFPFLDDFAKFTSCLDEFLTP